MKNKKKSPTHEADQQPVAKVVHETRAREAQHGGGFGAEGRHGNKSTQQTQPCQVLFFSRVGIYEKG